MAMANMARREGVIYSITSQSLGKIYIGSTFNYNKRISNHKWVGNTCTSKAIIGQADYTTNVLERVEVNSKKELHRLEGRHQLNYNGALELVNKIIAGRTKSEYRQQKKDMINEKHTCQACGGKYTRTNKSHHIKTKKHINSTPEYPFVI